MGREAGGKHPGSIIMAAQGVPANITDLYRQSSRSIVKSKLMQFNASRYTLASVRDQGTSF